MADRISMLPDELICHILYFLPTQDVVATSLLSKRWTRLWRSVSSLYFNDLSYVNDKKTYDCFQKFISRTFIARDAHQPIKRLCLYCEDPNFNLSKSDLNVWVNNAIARGLENLHLHLPDHVPFLKLRSCCIFSCKTLVGLKLVGLDVDAFSSVELPSLKTICLYDVNFPEQKYVMELLSGCPVLENVQLYDIGYVDNSTPAPLNNKVTTLSKLVRADIGTIGIDIPLQAICNVEFLSMDQCPDEIPVFPNLTHLELQFVPDTKWHWVLAIIKKIPKLQSFVLNMVESSADAMGWAFPCSVPICLSSQLRVCSITNFEGTDNELHFVKYIIQSSGVLRTMTVRTKTSISLERRFEMLQELSLCPRSSTICELSFK